MTYLSPEDGATLSLLSAAAEHVSNAIMLLHVAAPGAMPSILYANPEAERTTGFSAAELAGKPVSIFAGPETDLTAFASFREAISRGETARTRLLQYKKDGTAYWVELADRRIRKHPGGGDIVVSVRQNVDAEMRLRYLLDACSDMISRHDAEGRFLFASPSCQDLLGYSYQELLGRRFKEFVLSEDVGLVDQLMDGTPIGASTFRMRRKDGSSTWVESRGRIVRDPVGERIREAHLLTRDIGARVESQVKLFASETRYRQLFEANPSPMWIYDPTTLQILAVNDEAVKQYGYPRKEFLSRTISDMRPPEEVPRMLAQLSKRLAPVHDHGEWCHRKRDGEMIDVHVVSADIEWAGRPARLALLRDVTEVKKAHAELLAYEDRLKRSEHALASAQSVAHIGSWDFNVVTKEVIWTDELYRIYGLQREEYPPDPGSLWQFDHPDDVDEVRRQYADAEEHRHPYSMVHRLIRRDGDVRWVHEVGRFEYDADGAPIREIGTIQDITDRKRAEDRLAFLAHFDPLTGLPNRVLLEDRLKQSIARAIRDEGVIGVLFLDIDQFKQVNDSLGHSHGDAVLKETAARLSSRLREGDTICRYSGDEFIILLNGVGTSERIAAITQRLLECLAPPILVGDREINISASTGISVYPNDGADMEVLIKHADVAMYQAKHEGRNTFRFYQPAMQEAVNNRLSIENDLRRAIDKDEFVLHYQPIVDLGTQRVFAAEALIRWKHPQRGMVLPCEFIAIAEESGLIAPIGQWVVRKACADLAGWRSAGTFDFAVHVNVSPRQFRQPEFVNDVIDAVASAGIPPETLHLEITEGHVMDHEARALEITKRLKEAGIRIDLDDFGTGFSSLGRISEFPFDGLKIDRSFVAKIDRDRQAQMITRAIISLAQSLGLSVVAEGIENIEQLDTLKRFGCMRGQGYLFSKPVCEATLREIICRGVPLNAVAGSVVNLKPRASDRSGLRAHRR